MSESNIQQNKGKPNDEIDIFEFSIRISNAFKNFLIGIKDYFISFIIFLIRKSLWISSFAVAGVLLGYLLYGISKPSYSSLMEGHTSGLDNTVVIDHINKLSKLRGKPDLLANYLDITENQAKDIKSIKACYGIDINRDGKTDYIDYKEKYNPKDTNQMRVQSHIYLQVAVYNERIFNDLRQGLLQYIVSNKYLKELFKIDTIQKRQMINEIDIEILKIDSLQRSRFRKNMYPPNTNMLFMGNEPEIKLFHEEKLSLFSRRQRLVRDIEISDEIIVIIHDFTPLAEEENPILVYILIFGGSMAILGIFCSLLWQHRKKIWALIREDTIKQ